MPSSVSYSVPLFSSFFSGEANPSSFSQPFKIGHNKNTSVILKTKKAPLLHVAAGRTSSANSIRKTQRQEDDDYHATLKALNSKGRFPRKSLGQVSILYRKWCLVFYLESDSRWGFGILMEYCSITC